MFLSLLETPPELSGLCSFGFLVSTGPYKHRLYTDDMVAHSDRSSSKYNSRNVLAALCMFIIEELHVDVGFEWIPCVSRSRVDRILLGFLVTQHMLSARRERLLLDVLFLLHHNEAYFLGWIRHMELALGFLELYVLESWWFFTKACKNFYNYPLKNMQYKILRCILMEFLKE